MGAYIFNTPEGIIYYNIMAFKMGKPSGSKDFTDSERNVIMDCIHI